MSDEVIVCCQDIVEKGGSLLRFNPYVSWPKGESGATLDGWFTAAELRAIADHMEKHS